MCVVSMIGDHYGQKWQGLVPTWSTQTKTVVLPSPISREEFDALKRDVEEMKALLKRAREYDERNNEPDCELDEKMTKLRAIAALVGISLDDVIPRKGGSNA